MALGSLTVAQEKFQYNLSIVDSSNTGDSLFIPAGFSPVAIWTANLVAGTTVKFLVADGYKNNPSDSGIVASSWRWVGSLEDTTLYSVPLSKDTTVVTVLNPVIMNTVCGESRGYGYGTWLKPFIDVVQDNVTVVLTFLFKEL